MNQVEGRTKLLEQNQASVNRETATQSPTKKQGQPMKVVPAKALRQSGDHCQKKIVLDFRSMTLRRQVSLVLPFGQPVGLDQRAPDFRCLALRHHLSAD